MGQPWEILVDCVTCCNIRWVIWAKVQFWSCVFTVQSAGWTNRDSSYFTVNQSIALARKHLACFSFLSSSSTIIFPPSSPLCHKHVMHYSTCNILCILSRFMTHDVFYWLFWIQNANTRNFAISLIEMDIYLTVFARTCPPAFRLGSGAARIQAWLATLNPGGAPSSLVQVDGPVHGSSAGGLQGASCQKQGEGKGFLYGHLALS